MITYPAVNLPNYFSHLLMINMQSSGHGYSSLNVYISEHPDLYAMVEVCFAEEFGHKFRVDKIVKSLGWHGFRDRLAALYFYKLEHGKLPEILDTHLIDDVLAFEDKVKDYTVDGYSRGFLLGFYLKLAIYKLKKNHPDSNFSPLLIDDQTVKLLSMGAAKVLQVDWLLLLLKHVHVFLGLEETVKIISRQNDFRNLVNHLSWEQTKIISKNFLVYGSSIRDFSLFTHRTI